jgi:hypothetical protein
MLSPGHTSAGARVADGRGSLTIERLCFPRASMLFIFPGGALSVLLEAAHSSGMLSPSQQQLSQSIPHAHWPVHGPRFDESRWPLSRGEAPRKPFFAPRFPIIGIPPTDGVLLRCLPSCPPDHIPDGLYESSGWIPFTIHAGPACIDAGSSIPLHIAFLCLQPHPSSHSCACPIASP